MINRSEFIHPHSHFYGKSSPENIKFYNLMEDFVQEASLISNLAGNGKMSLDDAFSEIEELWKQVIKSKEDLGIGNSAIKVK